MVETKLRIDENHVLARYVATDKEIKPLYTKTNHDLVSFFIGMSVGFPLALVLALVGYIFEWRLRRMEGATGTARQLFGIGRLGRLTALTCMWFFIAFAVAIVLSKLGLIFLLPAWWYCYAITRADKMTVGSDRSAVRCALHPAGLRGRPAHLSNMPWQAFEPHARDRVRS